jgi:thyrotropin-releasing hormone receptor
VWSRCRLQITPTNHLLTALAIADLLTMISYLPYAVYFYCITLPDEQYGHSMGWVIYLLFNTYFTITTHTAAMWLTVALAVFRYLVVCCQQSVGARLCSLRRAKV